MGLKKCGKIISRKFRSNLKNLINPYYKKNTSKNIIKILKNINLKKYYLKTLKYINEFLLISY